MVMMTIGAIVMVVAVAQEHIAMVVALGYCNGTGW